MLQINWNAEGLSKICSKHSSEEINHNLNERTKNKYHKQDKQ